MSDNEWFHPPSEFLFMALNPLDDSKIYLHYPSNLTVESKFIRINARDYNRIKDLSKWRFQTQYPVFKILKARVQQEKRENTLFEVFLQKPQYLLYELDSISLLQALYVIKSCLPTLERLVEKFGYFELTNKMIGISRSNECKLWINEKLEKFTPDIKTTSQQSMTYQLLKLVQKKTCVNLKAKEFFHFAEHECTTFMKAQKFLSIYTYEEDLVIPPQFFSKNRRGSIEITPVQKPFKKYSCQSCTRSFVLNSTERQHSPHYIPKSQKKPYFLKQTQRPCVITFNKDVPMKLSSRHSLKTTCQMKQSKQTMMPSNDSLFRSNYFQRKSLPDPYRQVSRQFLPVKQQWFNSSIQNSQRQIFRKIEEERKNKKLTIMSTIDMKIVSDRSIEEALFLSEKKTRENNFEMKEFCKEKLQNNQWKKTISQLFSSDKNLKQSMNYGEEEKTYLKEIQLHRLGQFGRYINTSLLEIQQQDPQVEFKKIPN